MARDKDKEREKLYKGADDKAITFQRAVFIVCNLKRLIKRPKKEDKLSINSSGSRKRSAGNEDQDDRISRSSRRSRFKDPVRRALTLPTILCNSFNVGLTVGQQIPGVANEICSTNEKLPTRASRWLADDCPAVRDIEGVATSEKTSANQLTTNTSLSCLITPIRRANHSTNWPPPAINSRCTSRAEDNWLPQVQEPQPICCPIWLRAMDQLDAHQGQPRDQSGVAHFIGASSAGCCLQAPIGDALVVSNYDNEDCDITFEDRQFVRPSESHLAEGSSSRRYSGDAAPTQRRSSRSTNKTSKVDLVNLLYFNQDNGSELSTSKATKRNNSTSPELDCEQRRSTGFKGHPSIANQAAQRLELMRLKRLSNSTICLSTESDKDPKPKQQVSSSHLQPEFRLKTPLNERPNSNHAMGALVNENNFRPQHRKSTASIGISSGSRSSRVGRAKMSTASECGSLGLLAADDPMIYARRRRPSVCNQRSVNVDQQALFTAVECNQLERARAVLEDGKVDVNSLNGDQLTCLDIAVLMRNFKMIDLLQRHNAKEGSAYLSQEGRANQLYCLYMEARRLVEDLSRSMKVPAKVNTGTIGPESSTSLLSNALLEEKQRQLQYWRRRLYLFMQMRYEFERLLIPNAPDLIILQVVGENSLSVKIVHSLRPRQKTEHLVTSDSGNIESPINFFSDSICTQSMSTYRGKKSFDPSIKCPLGSKCSHMMISEYTDHLDRLRRQESCKLNSCKASDKNDSKVRSIGEYEQAKSSERTLYEKQHNTNEDRVKQEKLAIFNELLNQQLILLSNQRRVGYSAGTRRLVDEPERQPQQDNKLNLQQTGELAQTRGQVSGSRSHLVGKFAQHNSNSTETACDSVGKKHSSFLNDGEHSSPVVGERLSDLEPCHSVAYRLLAGAAELTRPACNISQLNEFCVQKLPDSSAMSSKRPAPDNQMIITKYKVEWSLNETMDPVINSMIVYSSNVYPIECRIDNLKSGQLHYVRVYAGNHKGFSEPKTTLPICLAPSSWRQLDGNKRKKYDEEVFKRFTRLILLNRHILDDSQLSLQQQQQLCAQLANLNSSNRFVSSGIHQNKSSLINMLLLDATMPTKTNFDRRDHRFDSCINYATANDSNQRNRHLSLYSTAGIELSNQKNSPIHSNIQNQNQQSSLKVRKNLKNLFQSNNFKFNKLSNQNKRGLYLATIIYHQAIKESSKSNKSKQQDNNSECNTNTYSFNSNDKIVVTNDERLPVIEVLNDPISASSLMSDFYWLLKINGTQWMDIKRLRQQLQKSHSSSTLHLRIKLLNAIEQMQSALNLDDIGRLFYKPIQAHDGSMVICTCKQVDNTKLVSNLSIKWTYQHKIIPRHLRKISESVSQTSKGDQQQFQCSRYRESNRRSSKKDSRVDVMNCAGSPIVLPGAPLNPLVALPLAPNPLQLAEDISGGQLVTAGGLVVASTTTAMGLNAPIASTSDVDPKLNSDNQMNLCDQCHYKLIQRRRTMASGSSSSSLASNESQRSCGMTSISTNASGIVSCGQSIKKCSCGRRFTTSNPNSVVTLAHFTAPGQNLNSSPSMATTLAGASQRHSASSRSGSMINYLSPSSVYVNNGSNSVDSGSTGASNQRASQSYQLNGPQKSSTYLMLASLSLYDLLLFTLKEIVEFDKTSTVPLNRGLYLGFVQLQTTVESMRLLVPRDKPNMVPCTRIRDNSHVSKEEWQLLKRFAHPSQASSPSNQQTSQFGGLRTSKVELASGGKQSNQRLSDPSIGSALKDDQLQVGCSLLRVSDPKGHRLSQQNNENLLSLNSERFDRTRAKSVSPGLMKDSGQLNFENRANLWTIPNLTTSSDLDLRTSTIPSHDKSSKGSTTSSSDSFAYAKTESDLIESNNKRLSGDLNEGTQCRSPTSESRVTVNSFMNANNPLMSQTPEETFVRLVGSAARRLLAQLSSQMPQIQDPLSGELVSILPALNDQGNNRVYHVELIELSHQITFILLIPSAGNVCPVTSQEKSNILADNKDFMLLPLQIFETIHVRTYEPDLLGKYSRLSTILETELIVAQHDHRQAFSSSELKSTKSRVNNLQDMVTIADEFWRQLRWIVDVVSFARDKSASNSATSIRLSTIWRYFDLESSDQKFTGDGSAYWRSSTKSLIPSQENGVMSDLCSRSNQVTRGTDDCGVPQPNEGNPTTDYQDDISNESSHYRQVKRTASDRITSQQKIDFERLNLGSVAAINRTSAISVGSYCDRYQNCLFDKTSDQLNPIASPELDRTYLTNMAIERENPPAACDTSSTKPNDTNRKAKSSGSKWSFEGNCNAPDTIQAKTLNNPQVSGRYLSHETIGRHNGQIDSNSGLRMIPIDSQCLDSHLTRQDHGFECAGLKGRHTIEGNAGLESDNRRIRCTIFHDQQVKVNEIRVDEYEDTKVEEIADDDEDEAIYAYHILLRDATRAAVERKNSQHSVKAVIEGEENVTSPLPLAATSTLENSPLSGNLTHEVSLRTRSNQKGGLSEMPEVETFGLFEWDNPVSSDVVACHLESACGCPSSEGSVVGRRDLDSTETSGQHEASSKSPSATFTSRAKHFKSTNPFLSDSFD